MLAPAQPQTVTIAPGVTIPLQTRLQRPRHNDLGRYEATGRTDDRWRFLTPTLRNVALTAPYMHDGSLPTLERVVEHYAAGGVPHEGQDTAIRPLQISTAEKSQLVAFLQALTSANIQPLAQAARKTSIGSR